MAEPGATAPADQADTAPRAGAQDTATADAARQGTAQPDTGKADTAKPQAPKAEAGDRPANKADATPGPGKPAPGKPADKKPADKKPGPGPANKGEGGEPPRKKPAKQAETVQVIEVAPVAQPAVMRKRHWGLALVFVLMVVAPLTAAGWYLEFRSEDQYASIVGFTVRKEEGTSATELLTPLLGGLGGGGGSSDSDVLYEFIQSQSLVSRIDERVDLVGHYSVPYDKDPIFALNPDATIEDLTNYWSRVVQLSYDSATGLMELRVLAFEAEQARTIARAIVEESQALINDLNATARSDTLRYAQDDLADAESRLRDAREALVLFRTRTQIVDPETYGRGQESLINVLQQQLAQALIDYDLLLQGAGGTDPRVAQAQSRIDAIRARIDEERESSVVSEDYPRLLAEYESLAVDREFAEESYRAARAALDSARADVTRQTRYLAAYIEPTLPQSAEYPRRLVLMGLAALFLFLSWAIVSLVYYSIRDSR
ncbi:sugar transporter [Roseisalinus antarcticus]|uniref:sugar transporter n=1 Tax=Roseisalinus antarcticus TaxID=254357 RepID=UPI001F351D0A|nr:sugar transporter [Roseisalinus antarcticus]